MNTSRPSLMFLLALSVLGVSHAFYAATDWNNGGNRKQVTYKQLHHDHPAPLSHIHTPHNLTQPHTATHIHTHPHIQQAVFSDVASVTQTTQAVQSVQTAMGWMAQASVDHVPIHFARPVLQTTLDAHPAAHLFRHKALMVRHSWVWG